MPHRPDSQIRKVFNPDNPQNAIQLEKRMKSKIGRFVGVLAVTKGQAIGYAWATDDVGNISRSLQHAKTRTGRLQGKLPYAWNAQSNVMPAFQGMGLGTAMLQRVYEPFDATQKPTAYVFDENPRTLAWYKNYGFEPDPEEAKDPNEPDDKADMYFGEDAEHVQQWRLVAPSITAINQAIAARFPNLPQFAVVDR